MDLPATAFLVALAILASLLVQSPPRATGAKPTPKPSANVMASFGFFFRLVVFGD
jgi:hypothetical protein